LTYVELGLERAADAAGLALHASDDPPEECAQLLDAAMQCI
jgi:hypothetical protein